MKHSVLAAFLFFPFLFFFSDSAAQPKYEFRGVWIATVDNIDWPSKGNFNTDSQKLEFIKQLDRHKRNGINAVIVQVRPAADAFYPSPYEPWSEWLTGKQGKPPSPYYDPLAFMIEETHKRGMEFHAWCNPYRAVFNAGHSSISPTHVTRIHPGWFMTYGDVKYFDPGNKEVQQYVTGVIRDLVSRYDIDAVHFDDYFYPYRIPGREFPDDASWRKYGNGMERDEWRRANTDSIIVMLGRAIKEEKKYCKFGISPFGVWRNRDKDPEGSETRAGQTNYDDLYADILLWLKNGWIDYVAPQLYWEFGQRAAPYEVLLDWWARHTYGRQCYIGLGIFKAGSSPAWREKSQLPRQIQALRSTENVQGMIFFSSASFEKNPNGWNDSLQENYFRNEALIPPMEWIDSIKPPKPLAEITGTSSYFDFRTLHMKLPESSKSVKAFVVYRFALDDSVLDRNNALSIYRIIPSAVECSILLPNEDANNFQLAVSCIDTHNNESEAEFLPVLLQNPK
jgi:uncharacterized lipoprotein YddW (UPF0748 family)